MAAAPPIVAKRPLIAPVVAFAIPAAPTDCATEIQPWFLSTQNSKDSYCQILKVFTWKNTARHDIANSGMDSSSQRSSLNTSCSKTNQRKATGHYWGACYGTNNYGSSNGSQSFSYNFMKKCFQKKFPNLKPVQCKVQAITNSWSNVSEKFPFYMSFLDPRDIQDIVLQSNQHLDMTKY